MQWTESVGLTLVNRDLTSMQLKTPGGHILTYYILQIFPFTSESKRMGIIVRVIWGIFWVFGLIFLQMLADQTNSLLLQQTIIQKFID